jgi:hypothetical protein
MKNKSYSRLLRAAAVSAVALTLLLVSAPAWAQKTPEPSGFLSDYSMLAEDPEEKESRLIYRNPDYDMGDFDALYLEELVFYLHPQDEGEQIDADKAAKMLRLKDRFDDVLREELEQQGANLVFEAGPGVLHCRWAITNLAKTKSAARMVPQARAIGKGRGGAAMEGECRDGEAGEIVAQVVKADTGARKSGVTTWAGAESAIRSWARQLAGRLAAKRDAG